MDEYEPADTDLLDLEAPDLHWLFRQSKDVRYAAMAVGRWPSRPPLWAMIACYGAHEAWLRSAATGADKEKIGIILDEMLKVYFDFENAATDDDPKKIRNSEYKPPARKKVLRLALERLDIKVSNPEELRALYVTLDRRMSEEAENEEAAPTKMSKLHMTKRYLRVGLEHETERHGGPSYRYSLQCFLQARAAEGE